MEIIQNPPLAENNYAAAENSFISAVFGWMAGALCVSAIAAFAVASIPAVTEAVFGHIGVFYVLLLVELLFVMFFSARVARMPLAAARALFVLYAILNGITLAVIFLVYTTSTIAETFLVAAGTFGVMALYGYFTKRDLSSWGNLLLMFLVGLILTGIVNMFVASSTLYWTTTIIGIGVFIGLTAYDTQRIKALNASGASGETGQKLAIIAALALYLDFINLFLYLLRIFGRRR